ncbi:MAG: M28 family peptidase, partial [bacterium]
PVGADSSYFQSVSLRQSKVSPESQLSIEIDGEMIPLKYGEDFLVVSAPDHEVEFESDLIFTGFGIQAPEYHYDDFENVDVAGKVTLYLTGEPESGDADYFKGQASSKYTNGRVKRNIARSLNARATIGIARTQLLQQMSWNMFRKFYTSARVTLSNRSTQRQARLPALFLHPNIGKILFSNTQMNFEGIEQAAAQDSLTSFAMNRKVRIKARLEEKQIEDRNVVALLEGSDPELKSEVVVFSAHYDHVGIGATVDGDSVYNGAADNASGIAGLLELAEAFSTCPDPPKRSLLFLAVTAEEKGLLGSEYYVENPIFPLSKTAANFNFDMIGWGDTTGIVVYGAERSSLGEDIHEAADKIGLKILPDELPEQRIFYRSDHYNFARKGIPTVFPSFGLARESFPDFEAYYHTPSDDVNLPFNYNYMKKHVQVVYLAGLKVANVEEPPKWNPGDEFGKIARSSDE